MASQTQRINISSILKNNFHLTSSDLKLSKSFKQKPSVTYQKSKSLSEHLSNNHMQVSNFGNASQQVSNVAPFGKCKLCSQTSTAKLITNDKLNITEKIKSIENYQEREIIYAAQCSQQELLYIGHSGEQFSECFSNIATALKAGQATVNLQNIFTKVII